MKSKHLLLAGLILVAFSATAQPPAPPATPIDGGLLALLAGGTWFGVSRIRKSGKN